MAPPVTIPAGGPGGDRIKLRPLLPPWSLAADEGNAMVVRLALAQANRLAGGDGALSPVAMSRKSKGDSERRSRSKLYCSAVLAVTAGAVAYWSKSEADNAYDGYLRAAAGQRQRDLFDRAERYDRISGAAFFAMEAGIALTTYLLFFGR